MPNKFVFPGGAVDAEDAQVPLTGTADASTLARLAHDSPADLVHGCLVAAVRELWEETGLILGQRHVWPDPPEDWKSFAATGHRPDASGLSFVFRAVTPPMRPRRFDARFFLCPASQIKGSSDDFSHASDELSHLQWIPLANARSFDLPFITEIVLAEIGPLIASDTPPQTVPFVRNDDPISGITRIR